MTSDLASHEVHIANNEKPAAPVQSHQHWRNDPPNKNPSASENFYHELGQVPAAREIYVNALNSRIVMGQLLCPSTMQISRKRE